MGTRSGNAKLAGVIAEAGLSHAQLARAFVRVALESGANELATIGRSHVSHWVGGSTPSGRAPWILCEALSRKLGRIVTTDEIGLTVASPDEDDQIDWRVDTLTALASLRRVAVDAERRRVLGAAAYSVAALVVPGTQWWTEMARRGTARQAASTRSVGRGDVDAVRDMVSMFSQIDQRRGGGHVRTALVQYLTSDVAAYLHGIFSSDHVRRDMFSTASELAYLCGWTAFDNAEHATAPTLFHPRGQACGRGR